MPELKKVSQKELNKILEQHKLWVETSEQEGKQADLIRADLSGMDLSHWDLSKANLYRVNLSKADLIRTDLSGTNLFEADLSKAKLSEADLRGAAIYGADLSEVNLNNAKLGGAILIEANLSKAKLVIADLVEAGLNDANLNKAKLIKAKLNRAILSRANLNDADLRQADLSEADLGETNIGKADLRWANLSGANLRKANLSGANLDNAKLDDAELRSAILRDAVLREADFYGAKGLSSEQFSGTDVTGIKNLPDNIEKSFYTGIERAKEASINARKLFFGMLLICAYSALTIFTTNDVDFLKNSASSTLPIIGGQIPITGFFMLTPLLLIGFYLYFHLYLQRLWDILAKLPAIFPDGNPLNEKVYPWLLNGLVFKHFELLKTQKKPRLSRIQHYMSIFLAWWTVPLMTILFWWTFLKVHIERISFFHCIVTSIAVFLAFFLRHLAKQTLEPDKKELKKASFIKKIPKFALLTSGICFALLCHCSNNAIKYYDFPRLDISGADLSTKPSHWNTPEEYKALIKAVNLDKRNLRRMLAFSAFMPKTSLCGADLSYAYLREATLSGADLSEANLGEATLDKADLSEADLWKAKLRRADLYAANLRNADLSEADLWKAGLYKANLTGTNFTKAIFYWTDFTGAKGLTVDQLCKAKTLHKALLDENLLKKVQEKCPELLKEPTWDVAF